MKLKDIEGKTIEIIHAKGSQLLIKFTDGECITIHAFAPKGEGWFEIDHCIPNSGETTNLYKY